MADSQASPARRRLWSVLFFVAYIFVFALPLWYNSARVPRAPLPREAIAELEAVLSHTLAATLPSTITVYLVCPGRGYRCLEYKQLSGFAGQLGAAMLQEAGLEPEEAPLLVRVLNDAPGSCTATSWEAPGGRARRATLPPHWQPQGPAGPGGGGGGIGCLDLVSSPDLNRVVLGGGEREVDDWAAGQLAGQDRPGNYHIFVAPDPWLPADGLPYGSMGRRRTAFVRYPAVLSPADGSVVRLVSLMAAPAFMSYLGPAPGTGAGAGGSAAKPKPRPDADVAEEDGGEAQPLPLSAAAQLHLSFSLCNAHPSPYGDSRPQGTAAGASSSSAPAGGASAAAAAAAAAFTWDFAQFEAQFVGPVKQVLSPAVRLTVSSQVLYFTPARVNASWDKRHGAFVLPYSQLPFFVDHSWPLDPARAGLPASAGGGGELPYDVAAVTAGSRAIAVGEAMVMAMPQEGAAGRSVGEAAVSAALPYLLPPPAAEALPPAVLHFVLYAPPSRQRPLMLLGPDGERAPANSFRMPRWGMLQVLNQVPEEGLITAAVEQQAMEAFAVEFVSQLRALLGLGAARRRLLRLAAPQNTTTTKATPGGTNAGGIPPGGGPAVGAVSLLSALRTGLAPWEVDALVRRRGGEDARAAAATLSSLERLLRQVPTLAVPQHVGALVRGAVGALRRALAYAAEGRYLETSRATQEARSWAEAAFTDPALSSRLNVPDTHMVGVYLPFCLPAAVPLLQALLQEIRRRRAKAAGAEVGGKKRGKAEERIATGSTADFAESDGAVAAGRQGGPAMGNDVDDIGGGGGGGGGGVNAGDAATQE